MTTPSGTAVGAVPPPKPQENLNGRVRRALARVGATLGLGAVFVASLAGAVLLHIDLPPARRQIERFARSALQGVFQGSVEADGLSHVGLDGLAVREVIVRAPDGSEVLRARGVRIEASVPTIARSYVGSGDIRIGLPFVRIEQLDARVEPDASGQLTLVTAISPRATGEPSAPGRGVRVDVAHAEIGAAFVQGKPDGQHAVDAELRRLSGSVHVEPGATAIDLAPMGVTERAALPGVLSGTLDLHVRTWGPKTPEDAAAPGGKRLWGAFGGRIGTVEVVARGLLDGDHVEAGVVAPRARPGQVKALLPSYPLDDTVALSADASGDLPRIGFHATALTERSGSAGAEGQVVLGTPLRADLTFHTTDVDPRSAAPSAPDVRVTARGKVHAEIGSIVTLRAEVATDPTRVEGTPVPAAEAAAEYDGALWKGSAKVHEPGAPLAATFEAQKDGAVRFEASALAPSLAKVERARKAGLQGAARLHTAGSLRNGVLDAGVDGEVSRLRAGPSVALDRAVLRGRVHGPLAAPSLDLTLSASDVKAGGYGASDAIVDVSGSVTRPLVRLHARDTNENIVDVSADVDPKAGAAEHVHLRIEQDGSVAEGSIARIATRGGGLAVDGIAIDAPRFGKMNGSLGVAGGEITGSLHAERIDLGAVRKFAGLPRDIGGRADVDVELSRVRGGRKGTVRVALRDGTVSPTPELPLTGVTADLRATFDTDRVSADAQLAVSGAGDACARPIARLHVSGADARLQGPLLSAATWRRASGRAAVDADDWDLSCLAPALLPLNLPISEIFGLVSVKASVSRDRDARFPSVHDLSARTHYLSITGSAPPDSVEPPWSSRDIDVELTGDVDGQTGQAQLSAQLFDDSLLAAIDASTTLDLAALADPARRAAALKAAPLGAHVSVPRRKVETFRSLPSFVRDKLPSINGETAIDAYAAGSIAQPRAVVCVRGWGVAPGPGDIGIENRWAVPVDLDAAAFYDGKLAALDAHVRHRDREVAVADARVQLPLEKLRSGPPLEAISGGRGSVALTDLPLGDLPVLGDRAVTGHLSGAASIEGLGKAPRLALDLRSSDLAVGPDLSFREAHVALRTQRTPDPNDTTALGVVRLLDRNGGGLDAAGYLDLAWKSGLVPSPRNDKPADVFARFHGFRLAAVEPALGGSLRQVDGLVDGEVRLGWGRLDDTAKGTLDADLRVAGATVYIPQIGQEMHLLPDDGAPLHISATRTGEVRVEHLLARGNSGRLRASATAHLDGLTFQRATGEVSISDDDPLPVTMEGVEIGTLSGKLSISALNEPAPRKGASLLAVEVRSDDLHLQIPSSTSRDVQSLDPQPDIVILQPQKPPEQPEPPRGTEIQLVARLNDMVIEGDGVRITLSTPKDTPPTITVDAKTVTTGDIRLNKGTLEVMGRKFELDQGTVHLRADDSSNPYLNVTAHWDAPDGSTIYVDYIGDLKPITQEKLRIRSNPPRTQQQALAMILFGSETGGALTTSNTEGTGGAESNPANVVGQAAASVGGELASQQFNALLRGIAPLKGLSTRFGTTQGGGMKGSLVYQVGDTVSAVATVENATGSPGSSTTAAGTSASGAPGASVSVDWRFYKNWLIRASVGTAADIPKGEVDLLWQYRY
jgi:translocation and assembly module TamB